MEWVETTGKTVAEAKETALDRLGVADDDAEFEILEEPRNGLFGLIRGEARVRARIRPTEARPEAGAQARPDERSSRDRRHRARDRRTVPPATTTAADTGATTSPPARRRSGRGRPTSVRGTQSAAERTRLAERTTSRVARRTTMAASVRTARTAPQDPPVDPAAVGAAAVAFVEGLVDAFGLTGTTELASVDSEFEVSVAGDDLGLLIGPGGRTLAAVQDLARVAAQRRLGDHETRLRVDVAGYRERRRAALERFARTVAGQVVETGNALALEPMPSADRKIIHDVLATIDGVGSHSEGDDPTRRVVVTLS